MTNETIDKILDELKRVEHFMLKMKETGKAPDIERDIIMAKLRTMYEFLQFIQPEELEKVEYKAPESKKRKSSDPLTDEVSGKPKAEKMEHPVELIIESKQETVPEEIKKVIPVVQESTTIETIAQEDLKIAQETKPSQESKVQEIKAQETRPQEVQKAARIVESKPKTEILAEMFKSTGFLNETLSQYQNTQDLSKKYQHTPLKDIFSAISLNDRFLFINELFRGDAGLYQGTIEQLNLSGSFNAAVQYLDQQFQWDYNEPMVQKLLDLIHRRYLTNE